MHTEKAQPPIQCAACVYWDYNFTGEGHCEYSNQGYTDSTFIGDKWNDEISSVALNGSCAGSYIALYQHADFGGKNYTLGGMANNIGEPDLGHHGFNDETSSLKIFFKQAPVITINGRASMRVPVGFNYVEPGAWAADEDGSVNVAILESNVQTNKPGTSKVIYRAVDRHGNAATAIRAVTVYAARAAILKSVHSGKCLDVDLVANSQNGANAHQWDCHGGTNQKWELVPDGYFQIRAAHSGKCLEVDGGLQENGVNVLQWDCHGGTNQKWELARDGQYSQIRAVHSGKCLDVDLVANSQNGANAHQWDCHGGTNQRWALEPDGQIKLVHTGKCLEVGGALQENGANAHQWDCHGGTNQKWALVPDGGFQIRAAHSGKCLEVGGALQENGANVHQWDCHGGPNQKWEVPY